MIYNIYNIDAVGILQFFFFGVDFRFGMFERGKLSLQHWKDIYLVENVNHKNRWSPTVGMLECWNV